MKLSRFSSISYKNILLSLFIINLSVYGKPMVERAMNQKEPLPCGSWPSNITTSHLVEKAIRFGDIALSDGKITWVESRPSEKGRCALVQFENGVQKELISSSFWPISDLYIMPK